MARQPNWTFWGDMADVLIEEAVALSLDLDPEIVDARPGYGQGDEYARRLTVIQSHIDAGRLQVRVIAGYMEPPSYRITLTAFAEFADARNPRWSLPAEFREVVSAAKPATAVPTALPDMGGVSIALPHTTKDLEALFAIIREHWKDPTKPPKADAVGFAIDLAMGWKSTATKPSRTAQSLAGMLRPDGQAEADKRSSRRHKKS
jgi:hypothetical protein